MSYIENLSKWSGALAEVVVRLQKIKLPGGSELGDVSLFCDTVRQIVVDINVVRKEMEEEKEKYEE